MAKNDHMVQGEQRHFLLWRRKEANQWRLLKRIFLGWEHLINQQGSGGHIV